MMTVTLHCLAAMVAVAQAAVQFTRVPLQTPPESREVDMAVRMYQKLNCLVVQLAHPHFQYSMYFSVHVGANFDGDSDLARAISVERVDGCTLQLCFDRSGLEAFRGEVRVGALLRGGDGGVWKRRLLFQFDGMDRRLSRRGKVWLYLDPCTVNAIRTPSTTPAHLIINCDKMVNQQDRLVIVADGKTYTGKPGQNSLALTVQRKRDLLIAVRHRSRLIKIQKITV